MTNSTFTIAKIEDLTPGENLANKGSLRGAQLLVKSIEQCGLGRSIVVSSDDQVIAGNHILQQAAELGFERLLVVESDGTSLVAVKRTDLQAGSEKATLLARFDNRVAEVNLDWDGAQLFDDLKQGVPLELMFFETELASILGQELEALGQSPIALQTLLKGDSPQIPSPNGQPTICTCPTCGHSHELIIEERTT